MPQMTTNGAMLWACLGCTVFVAYLFQAFIPAEERRESLVTLRDQFGAGEVFVVGLAYILCQSLPFPGILSFMVGNWMAWFIVFSGAVLLFRKFVKKKMNIDMEEVLFAIVGMLFFSYCASIGVPVISQVVVLLMRTMQV